MKPRRYHGLKRPRLRQSWNKYNLFNIYRMRDPNLGRGDLETFFQQKWKAKGMLRNYHGEHVVERKWVRMFSRRLLSVAEMDPKYMAKYDGSELAAGRGSGKDKPPNWSDPTVPKPVQTPYMQMTFAPMERRLDIAVFRAMFASSARQARQFCVHGAVKVNGKVMPYPSYRLNPGDMFQVDPDRVLYATGLPKPDPNKKKNKKSAARRADTESEEPAEEETEAGAEEEAAEEAEVPEQDPDTTDAPEPIKEDMKPTRQQIQSMVEQAKTILNEETDLGVRQKQQLRKFIKQIRPLVSRAGRPDASPQAITEELSNLVASLNLSGSSAEGGASAATERSTGNNSFDDLSKDELKVLEKRMAEYIREEEENPWDPSKPYKTPWQPRHYMAPFAFIPKYLEVNHNICAAVYLRHPVARVGSAEVPTPFPESVSQLAFNWYLRRR
ncbi:alpha-L RNA-binding motif-containing protein [Daldinia caldariorum]|uniref:alpha-L RNA-binding motif-containing protein n=1 Tax=Daldinia caldariorum TaxID=326644 RepID=UPI002007DEF5|nr:alpha-L RNA-binding motif-containing protein [Daldinia caldariorum]KAI1469659.1 alpha-L RNA-binding motif-containing protein [Daldinia caldariorum]